MVRLNWPHLDKNGNLNLLVQTGDVIPEGTASATIQSLMIFPGVPYSVGVSRNFSVTPASTDSLGSPLDPHLNLVYKAWLTISGSASTGLYRIDRW